MWVSVKRWKVVNDCVHLELVNNQKACDALNIHVLLPNQQSINYQNDLIKSSNIWSQWISLVCSLFLIKTVCRSAHFLIHLETFFSFFCSFVRDTIGMNINTDNVAENDSLVFSFSGINDFLILSSVCLTIESLSSVFKLNLHRNTKSFRLGARYATKDFDFRSENYHGRNEEIMSTSV